MYICNVQQQFIWRKQDVKIFPEKSIFKVLHKICDFKF